MKDKPVILVVDDQPQNIELLEAYLAVEGYEIIQAANGEEALEKLSGKEPFFVEKSLAIIQEGRGSHFDPDVVDAFFAVKDEIIAIKKQYGEDAQQAFDIPQRKALLQHDNIHAKHLSTV